MTLTYFRKKLTLPYASAWSDLVSFLVHNLSLTVFDQSDVDMISELANAKTLKFQLTMKLQEFF